MGTEEGGGPGPAGPAAVLSEEASARLAPGPAGRVGLRAWPRHLQVCAGALTWARRLDPRSPTLLALGTGGPKRIFCLGIWAELRRRCLGWGAAANAGDASLAGATRLPLVPDRPRTGTSLRPGIGDPRSLPFDTTLLTQACILGYLPARGRQVDGPSAGTGGGASDGLGPACRPAGGHVLLVIS